MNLEFFDCTKVSETALEIFYSDLYDQIVADNYEPGGPGQWLELYKNFYLHLLENYKRILQK